MSPSLSLIGSRGGSIRSRLAVSNAPSNWSPRAAFLSSLAIAIGANLASEAPATVALKFVRVRRALVEHLLAALQRQNALATNAGLCKIDHTYAYHAV